MSLYNIGRYTIVVVDDFLCEDTGAVETAYGVLNTETNVTEFRTKIYHYAIRCARISESEARKLEALEEELLADIPQQGDLFNG